MTFIGEKNCNSYQTFIQYFREKDEIKTTKYSIKILFCHFGNLEDFRSVNTEDLIFLTVKVEFPAQKKFFDF